MKLLRKLTTLSSLALFIGGASIASAQAMFDFDVDDSNGHVNVPGVGASGTVTFTDPDAVSVYIKNDGTLTSSKLTGFYILKPVGINVDTLDSGLSGWTVQNAGNNATLNEFDPGLGEWLYFGANAQNPGPDGLAQGLDATFTFTMDGDFTGIDWDAYLDQEIPHIFLRWQEVVGGAQGSAKGYGGFVWNEGGTVPEPSAVASMAVLGMGILLYARRRLTRKK